MDAMAAILVELQSYILQPIPDEEPKIMKIFYPSSRN
jgi:hypothetical protein